LWRSTGLTTHSVVANDDAGQVASPAGGVAVPSVLANDWVAGVRATMANSQLSVESSSNAGVSLNLADGSVGVAPGTQAGTHTLIYKLCEAANSTNCDGAAVRVTVPPYVVKAVNDVGSASPSSGGIAIATVLANDTLGAGRATTANVFLSQLSSTSAGVSLNTTNGAVVVAQGTPIGTQSLLYKVCEIANPSNCDVATATVAVQPYVIDAVDDSTRASSKTGGTAIPNVLSNDRLGNLPASLTLVTLTQVSPAIPGITLVLNTGAVTVAPKTTSGLYTLIYKICETASASNCDQATVTLDLSGK
jgi:large repetitive protein